MGRAGVSLVVLTTALLAACTSYFGMPLDPTAAHIEPWVGHDGMPLEAGVPDGTLPLGIEGAVLFIRLRNADRATVMDTYFQWPRDRKEIPPGHYWMSAYWRSCEGNCGILDPASAPFCQTELDVATGDEVKVLVHPVGLPPGSSCEVQVLD